MDIQALQQTLRRFAAERNWEPFHTPKNLAMALMVEAAELQEIFQWMTPEQSQVAHHDAMTQQHIGEEAADILLYLLQLADHSQLDLEYAVSRKLVKNATKYPPVNSMIPAGKGAVPPAPVHVLIDWENVQPKEGDIRELVPGATDIWVFHGQNQKKVETHFASFGQRATLIPITRPGKNALDFHLSFYMGYIASRSPDAPIVVISNDKGYGPMLDHAVDLGFAAQQVSFASPKPPAKRSTAAKSAKAVPAAQTAAPSPSFSPESVGATTKKAVAAPPTKVKPPTASEAMSGTAVTNATQKPAAKKAAKSWATVVSTLPVPDKKSTATSQVAAPGAKGGSTKQTATHAMPVAATTAPIATPKAPPEKTKEKAKAKVKAEQKPQPKPPTAFVSPAVHSGTATATTTAATTTNPKATKAPVAPKGPKAAKAAKPSDSPTPTTKKTSPATQDAPKVKKSKKQKTAEMTLAQRTALVWASMQKSANKPAKKARLLGALKSLLDVPEGDPLISEILGSLLSDGRVTLSESGAVTYP